MLSIHGFITVPYLKIDPLWDSLRSDNLFQQLLQTNETES